MFSFLKRQSQADGLAGISFLPDGIAVAVIQRTDQKPVIKSCGFEPCSPAEYASALQKLVQSLKIQNYPCVAVLEPGTYTVLQVEAPQVDASEMKQAIRWKIKDLIDFHIDDAVIDVFDIPNQEQRGRAQSISVIATRASLIEERADLIVNAGLKLNAIDITELALRNITALLPEDQAGVAMAYLMNASGMILLTQDENLYLARTLDTSMGDTGQALYDTVVLEIQRSMDYYESYFSKAPISTIVIAPGIEDYAPIAEYAQDSLRVNAKLLALDEVLEVGSSIDNNIQSQCLLAIGGALRVEDSTL